MSDRYSPIKGKCTWWREYPVEEDVWDTRLKPDDKHIECTCFVEGKVWTVRRADLPSDCPESRHCRYHIRTY